MNSGRFSVHRFLLQIEPVVLFGVLYLPGYLAQTAGLSGDIFDSLNFNVSYWLIALFRIGLILYLVLLRSRIPSPQPKLQPQPTEEIAEHPPQEAPGTLKELGVVRIRAADLPWILAGLAVIEACIAPIVMASRSIAKATPDLLADQVHWHLSQPAMIPIVFVTSILVGYSEELYFRSYLLTLLPKMGVAIGGAVAASVLLFSLGHLYEGFAGIAGSAVIGVVLSLLFLKRRSLHVIALAHGLYNFTTLLMTLSAVQAFP